LDHAAETVIWKAQPKWCLLFLVKTVSIKLENS
jgi:hypothetical protein